MSITGLPPFPQTFRPSPWQPGLPGAAACVPCQGYQAAPQADMYRSINRLPPTFPLQATAGDPQSLGRYYFQLGERYYQANRFRQAVDAFSMVLAIDGRDHVALNKRGVAKAGLKDYGGAIADYTAAISLKPDFYNAYINRGNLKVYVKDYAGALEDYGRAIRIDPMNPVAYENRAEVYTTTGQRHLALQDKAMVIRLQQLKKATMPPLDLPYCPKRIALVLGNDDYAGTENDLTGGPLQDSLAMRRVLLFQGFEVITGINLTGPQMKAKVAEFITRLKQNPGAVSMIYYSGHGGSINGNNYLIPVDYTGIIDPVRFDAETVSVDYLLRQLKDSDSLFNMIILDACRNPLTGEAGLGQARPPGSKAPSKAVLLRQWESEPSPGLSNVWIEYASRPSMPALQHNNQGLYTKYLLQYMTQPGLSLKEVSMYTSYALERDPVAVREGQHARTQTDLTHTEALAESLSFSQPCSPGVARR